MSDQITRIELQAYTDANLKVAASLQDISVILTSLVTKQDKLYDRLYNGIVDDITERTDKTLQQNHAATMGMLKEMTTTQKEISRGVTWAQIFIGVLGFSTIVAMILAQVVP